MIDFTTFSAREALPPALCGLEANSGFVSNAYRIFARRTDR
ncbi:hypothetical protein [Parasphingopyxis algicola]|nr:hypothetical protein [Parasphingopyxis algicola]